jgi:hypothetical protein
MRRMGGHAAWSNGKVGINGISYYAMNQWQVARSSLRISPPVHLGGFVRLLSRALPSRRHPVGLSVELVPAPGRERAARRRESAAQRAWSRASCVAGPATLTTRSWRRRAPDIPGEAMRRRLSMTTTPRVRQFANITTPLAVGRELGGMGLHPRGNFEGWRRAGSGRNAGGARETRTSRISTAATARPCRSGSSATSSRERNTGWDQQPPVSLNVRHPGERFVLRAENEWPLARTQWTKYFCSRRGSQWAPRRPLARRH